ncbi:Hypothetical protein MexAM1_META2p0528 (plasmid) [Methylorubrum extorquens AM1]|uniref:Uncharacterized protein n=1 Tax=Methylorubrum extorquens (strain ATCC 14718 / DSM 1338 / JCM 2805 / NCIMB 9133 / AM1) TaxID=272630 RepID=C5B4J3_METEA|nr:Hypothetical protein MexAM1_META2p0528 [Methylorubrum extorquens AM1]
MSWTAVQSAAPFGIAPVPKAWGPVEGWTAVQYDRPAHAARPAFGAFRAASGLDSCPVRRARARLIRRLLPTILQ